MKTSKGKHEISGVVEGSIACELELAAGDFLIAINGKRIRDVLHYRYLTQGEFLTLEIEKGGNASPAAQRGSVAELGLAERQGFGDSVPIENEIWELEIEKDSDEDLGLYFTRPNMSPTRRCRNKCVFCFVDQQPKGLRKSLYVKDDDPWLSYLMGNYITLTNLSKGDVRRMAHFHLSPLRISVHAADMDLRCKMMGTPNAGNLFEILDVFGKTRIVTHFQAVLCRGLNDGEKLRETIEKLSQQPGAASLAIVPAGITRHREGLYPLTQFSPQEAADIIEIIEAYQENFRKTHNTAFVFAADEWYIMADKPLPGYKSYEDFVQLDNGVGVLRLFRREFDRACLRYSHSFQPKSGCTVGIITGQAAGAFMKDLAAHFESQHPGAKINVHIITNDFFGELITVSGLLTGQDIIRQLKGRVTEDILYLPENAFRAGTNTMLDGTTRKELSAALGIPVKIGSTDGRKFYRQLVRNL